MRNLKSHILKITNPVIRKHGFITAQIIFDWPLIVGEYLSKYTKPIKVNFPNRQSTNGVLHIEVISAQAPLIQQVEHEILEKIAAYSGFKAITKIKLIHSNRMPDEKVVHKTPELSKENADALDKMLEGIEDSELKSKLKNYWTVYNQG